jgi:hypothetical protein
VAGCAGPRAVRLVGARCGRAGHRTDRADDLRHLSDDALPPGHRGAEGGDRDGELCRRWADAGDAGSRKIGQQPVSWDTDETAARARAHDQFRWFAGGWKVNAELPGTAAFAAATQFVTPDDVAAGIPCGADEQRIVDAVLGYTHAGFTDVALCQIGDEDQERFLSMAGATLPSLGTRPGRDRPPEPR